MHCECGVLHRTHWCRRTSGIAFIPTLFRALQVAVHLDGRQAQGLTGPFGHQLTVLEIADAQFEASSGQSMRPEVASPGTLKITCEGQAGGVHPTCMRL